MAGDSMENDFEARAAGSSQPPVPEPPAPLKSRLIIGRALWLTVHKYIGLFAGAIFVLIGLTGSILAFGSQIDTWLNAGLMSVDVPAEGQAQYRRIAEILAAGKRAVPRGGNLDSLVLFPRHPGACFRLTYSVPAGKDRSKTYQIFVNPYTAAVTGQRLASDTGNPFARPLMETIASFHYTLLLGNRGETAVRFIGLFLFGSLVSGIVSFGPGRAAGAKP